MGGLQCFFAVTGFWPKSVQSGVYVYIYIYIYTYIYIYIDVWCGLQGFFGLAGFGTFLDVGWCVYEYGVLYVVWCGVVWSSPQTARKKVIRL